VKENQEKDKIGSKPDKNGKRGEAGKSLKQLQWRKGRKPTDQPLEENAEITDTIIESIPLLPIPVQDGNSQQEEINIVTKTDDVMPPSVENDNDDYDLLLGEADLFLSDDSIPPGLLDSECDFCKAFCLGFAAFTKGLGATVLIGLAAPTGAAAFEELYLAVLIGTIPDLLKTTVGAKLLL
nr:hypothetical protein [Tanacetum cinerariifolium]